MIYARCTGPLDTFEYSEIYITLLLLMKDEVVTKHLNFIHEP